MAFERMMDGEDDLQKQLERQLGGQAAPQVPGQDWQTYADKGTAPASVVSSGLGQATPPLNSPSAPKMAGGASGPQDPRALSRAMGFSDAEIDANEAKASALNAGSTKPKMAPAGAPSPANPASGGALARYGTGDIADAAGLSTGNYGGEGFSYAQRSAAGERGADTIKNSFGKIASRYDPTQPGASKAVMADPDFQRLFPEARLVEHPNGDMIDFGDGKPVDVLRAARAGGAGEAWQWGVQDGGGEGGTQPMGGMDINSLIAGIGGGADPMAAIQAQISAASNGQDEQTLIQQLLAQQGI